MKNYTILTNDYYEILLPISLKKYGEEVIDYSTNKFKEFLLFFKEKSYYKKIKGSFFLNRDDFLTRIREVAFDFSMPPAWATGCFAGGEIQILLSEHKLYERFYALAHETFHLLFYKFVYEKNNIDRIIWLDESLAINFDGRMEELIENNTFKNIIIKLINNNNLPKMNDLDFDKNNVKTDEYDGYDLFKVVGRYLVETKTPKELFIYINNKDKVLNDGEKILEDSLNYFRLKYNL